MGTIRHIFIAPERGAPMIELPEVEAMPDCGLRGDRYSDPAHRKSPDYQLTLIELEQIEAYTEATGLPMALHEPRRNLVTSGVDLNALNGRRFRVGEVELEGLDLCEPCGLLARRTAHEALRFFVHRGGLRCRILKGGVVHRGDTVTALA